MDLLEQITMDPGVRVGKPCVKATRLTVGDVLGTLAAGSTETALLEDVPQLTDEDMRAAGTLMCRSGLECSPAGPPAQALSKAETLALRVIADRLEHGEREAMSL